MNIEPNSKNEEIQKFNNDSIKKESLNENNYTMEKTESDKEEQEITPSIEKENQPFFIMTLEFEKGKQKKIKIFPNSDPTELSFNFCKDNNLDFVSMKYLTNEIQNLLNKFNENRSKFNSNLIINGSNNSIQEVDEENMLTEKTFEQKMSERSDINPSSVRNNINDNQENKSTRNNFIYSSIDSKGESNNQEENDINDRDDDAHIDKGVEEVDKDKSSYSKPQSEEEDNEEKIRKEKEIERVLNEKIKENISKQNEELRQSNYESNNNSNSNNSNDENDKEDKVKNKDKNNIFIENIYDVDKNEINNSSKGNSIENKKSIEKGSFNKSNVSNNSVNDLKKNEVLETNNNKKEDEKKKEKTISNKDKSNSKKEHSLTIKKSQPSSKKSSIEHEAEQVNYLSESQKLMESLLPLTTPKNSKSQKNLPKNNISKTEIIQSPSTKISMKNLKQNTKKDKIELSQVEDIAALLEIKKKKDLLNLQLEEELKKEQLLTEQKLMEQKLLEEEDQKDREEYLEYEQKQKKSISNNLKQNLILDEVDYNFQLDEMNSLNTSKEKDSLTLNSKNTNSIQNKSNRVTTKNNSTINNQEKSNSFSSSSNKPPLTNTNSSNTGLKSFSESQSNSKNTNSNLLQPTSATTQNALKTSKSQLKAPMPIPVSTTTSNIPPENKKKQKLFQYELLTENDAYESYLMQNGGNLFSSQSTQSMGVTAMISAANSNRNNNFISQRQKTNPTSNDILSHSNSFNIFEKLYNEAEVNRQLPKRPCHFSSRINNMNDVLIDEDNNHQKLNGNNKGYKNYNTTTNGNYGEYLYLKGKIQNEIKREKIAKYKYNLNMALRALCKSKPKINKYKRNLSLGVITKNFNIKKAEIDNGKSKAQSKKDSENKASKEKSKKKIQLLTKRNLENPILKQKLEQIKKEIEKKYTFKPKINSNYHFSPGLNFMQRQEIYNDYLSKKNNLEEEIIGRPYSTKKTSVTQKRQPSGNKSQQHPNKLIKQKKNYNTFNKNLNFDLTTSNYIKTNTSQTHISLYKSTNQTKRPFLCTSPNSTSNTEHINSKKKLDLFKKIFSKLDSDEDNLISYISYNKKNLPSNIFKIISPMINQMVKEKGIMSKENFMENMEEIYSDLDINEKRILSDYYSKEHNSEKAKSKNQNNEHVKKINQRSRKNSESYVKNYDKKMIQSLSLNNIVKNGKNEKKIIDRNDYFRDRKNNYSNIELKKKNGICITDKSSNNISGIKNYTFTTYKNNLSYELIN